MPNKSQINATLKSLGYESVKMTTHHGTSKVYRDWNNKICKGIRGGSIGPMTVTNAAQVTNAKVLDKLREALGDIGLERDHSDPTGMRMYYFKGRKRIILEFNVVTFPAYYRSSYSNEYQNYYITVKELIAE